MTLDLGRRGFVAQLADVVREARRLIGWSQRELARRADTSQATIWRLENGLADRLDLLAVERVLTVLGIRASLQLDARHLADRRRQRDALHARLTGFVAGRLDRLQWLTATEVLLGEDVPRGWIDLLAYRERDGALLVEETKTDLPDIGALQRSLAFYEREAWAAARRLGWRPRQATVLVVALDTEAIAARLRANRELLVRAFPAPVDRVAAWLADPASPAPRGWALATADPGRRTTGWLRPGALGSRRQPPAYVDYADAASRLGRTAKHRRR